MVRDKKTGARIQETEAKYWNKVYRVNNICFIPIFRLLTSEFYYSIY